MIARIWPIEPDPWVVIRPAGDDDSVRLASPGLANLADSVVLRELVALPESDQLEGKRSADAVTLAKVVSGFANANGGWLLLGVDDDGGLVGWQPKGNAHLRDWLRNVLDNHLDPPPHFVADVFALDGESIGVVRVPRSAAAPHFMVATSEVFERRNGQTRRAPPARVRELMLRDDREAKRAAQSRLDDREAALDVAVALDTPPAGAKGDEASAVASVVRVSLTEVPETFQAWVCDPPALASTYALVESAASRLGKRRIRLAFPTSGERLTARGHSASAHWDGRMLRELVVAWDAIGLGGVRVAGTRIDDSGVLYLLSDEVRDVWVVVTLEYLLTSLDWADVFGPAIVRWNLRGIDSATVMRLRDRGVVASRGQIPDHHGTTVALQIEIDVGVTIAAEASAALWGNSSSWPGQSTSRGIETWLPKRSEQRGIRTSSALGASVRSAGRGLLRFVCQLANGGPRAG